MKPVWKARAISRKAQTTLFEAHVMSILMYECCTWNLSPTQFRRINQTYVKMVRYVLKLPNVTIIHKPSDPKGENQKLYISYEESLKVTHTPTMQERSDTRILFYAGHVARMGPERIPNRLLFGSCDGQKRGRKQQSMHETIAQAAERAEFQPFSWKLQSQNRKIWNKAIYEYRQTK